MFSWCPLCPLTLVIFPTPLLRDSQALRGGIWWRSPILTLSSHNVWLWVYCNSPYLLPEEASMIIIKLLVYEYSRIGLKISGSVDYRLIIIFLTDTISLEVNMYHICLSRYGLPNSA